jgi:hypothetical protein
MLQTYQAPVGASSMTALDGVSYPVVNGAVTMPDEYAPPGMLLAGWSANPPALQSREIIVNAKQMAALYTTPLVIVPAPAANQFISVLGAVSSTSLGAHGVSTPSSVSAIGYLSSDPTFLWVQFEAPWIGEAPTQITYFSSAFYASVDQHEDLGQSIPSTFLGAALMLGTTADPTAFVASPESNTISMRVRAYYFLITVDQ